MSSQEADTESLAEPLLHDAPAAEPSGRSLHRIDTFSEDGKYFDRQVHIVSLGRPATVSEAGTPRAPVEEDTLVTTTLTLAKVILGTGILVIPKAFQLLGIALGLAVLALVGLLTWFTIVCLTHRATLTGKDTYAGLIRAVCGKPAKWGILFSVFTNCLGMCTAMLIIFSDILLGSSSPSSTSTGLLPELLPGLPRDSLLLDRRFVLAALLLLVFLPLTLQRNLASLGVLNAVGVGAVVAFAASSSLVAGAALYKSQGHALPWLPDWAKLGDTPVGIASSLLAIGPILLTADICHQSVFPTMAILKPYTEERFSGVVAAALTICNVLYTLIAVTCIVAFGDLLEDDALSNFDATLLTPLIGPVPAACIGVLVRLSFFISLIGSFILQLYPLRHCVLEVLLGFNYKTKKSSVTWRGNLTEDRVFGPVTVALLLLTYALAVLIPSIWVVLSLVGSCCATLIGFIFPALVVVMSPEERKGAETLKRAVAWGVLALGVVLFVNGLWVGIKSLASPDA